MKPKQLQSSIYIALLIMAVACRSPIQEESKKDPEKYRFTTIKVAGYQIPVRATGMLASKTQSNLSFMTGGVIRKLNVREGSEVKKGQVLAELDLTEIDSRVKQASLAMDKAMRDYQRLKALYADSVATLENLQDIETSVEMARANLRIASFNRDYSKILAPADGKILKKIKEINEITAPGHPVFVFASVETDWVLKVSLSDRDVVRINSGDSAIIHFDAYPGKDFKAEVLEIANAANLLNGTFEVELKLKELPERLVTGLIGSATIFPPKQSYPLVPYIAITEASGMKASIYRIEEGKPTRREVKIFAIADEGVFIEEGVEAGDTIVTDGAAYLR